MRYLLLVALLPACSGAEVPDAVEDDDIVESDSLDSTPSACLEATTSVARSVQQITVGGIERSFELAVPAADAGVALPVLFAFHGGGEGDHYFPQQGAFDELGAITVYPRAKLVPPNEGAWQLNTTEASRHDIDFVEAVLDSLAETTCVDTARIYATGYSLGSMFTYELACHANTRFAAIASFAGTMPVSPNSCQLQDPIGVMHIHGQDDWLIAYDSEWDWKEWDSVGRMRDIGSLVEFWAQKNHCASESEVQEGSALHIVHDDCDGGVRVEHYGLRGVEHDWPSSIGARSTHQVVWDFVSGFKKPSR